MILKTKSRNGSFTTNVTRPDLLNYWIAEFMKDPDALEIEVKK